MSRPFITSRYRSHHAKKRVAFCFGLALAAFLSQAAHAQDGDCPQNTTGQDSPVCVHAAFIEADAKLNDAYRSAVSLLGSDAKLSQAKMALIASQRAWIKFRDADCKVQSDLTDRTSTRDTVVESCLTDLTEERTDELQQIWVP
ncbi:MAG TPA: lysozyme inhibitor LprI family protein [Pararobbsia sp.]|nr:lysozyme inhibitor LprI family protein [Pararobbsia sp.]